MTERSGRVHTSAISVAILPQADEVIILLNHCHAIFSPTEIPVQKVDQMVFSPMKRGRERPKRTLREIIRRDLGINGIPENLIWDREQ